MALDCQRDGSLIACADDTGFVRVWNVENEQLVLEVKAHDSAAQGLSFSRDGNLLVSASNDSGVKVWTVRTDEVPSRWVAIDNVSEVDD